jgi:hypothetical protein
MCISEKFLAKLDTVLPGGSSTLHVGHLGSRLRMAIKQPKQIE